MGVRVGGAVRDVCVCVCGRDNSFFLFLITPCLLSIRSKHTAARLIWRSDMLIPGVPFRCTPISMEGEEVKWGGGGGGVGGVGPGMGEKSLTTP